MIPLGQPVPKGGGRYATRSASPIKVDGVWYQPREDTAYDRVGTASWYGELFHGRRTANGEIYDMDRLSAASPTLPLPGLCARDQSREPPVDHRSRQRSRSLRDRTASWICRGARRRLLGFRDNGTARVRVQYLGRAPLNGDDSYERRYLASQSWAQVASRERRQETPLAVGSIADRREAAGEKRTYRGGGPSRAAAAGSR